MEVADLLVDPATVWALPARPLGVVDLDRWPAGLEPSERPAWPVVGVGAAAHSNAGWCDAVIEAPVSLAAVARSIAAAPRAAAVAVDLLRGIEGLPVEHALPLESLVYGALQGSEEHRRWLAGDRPVGVAPGRLLMRRERDDVLLLVDRPQARNALDRSLRDALARVFTALALDPSVARIRLRARGPAFGVGGDLAEFGTTRDPAAAHAIRRATLPAAAVARCADRLDVHVRGGCVGASLEIAAFARRLTAAPGAWFQLPELAMGLIPGAGGCVSVPHRVGRSRAALMILSGRRIGAGTALAWGLIDAIVDEPSVDPDGTGFDLV